MRVEDQPDDEGYAAGGPCVVSYRMRCGHSYPVSLHDPKDPDRPFLLRNVGSVIYCTRCDAYRLILRATFYLVDHKGRKRVS